MANAHSGGIASGPDLNHGQAKLVTAGDNTVTVGTGGAALNDGILPIKVGADNTWNVNGVTILHGQLKIVSA